MNDIDTATRLHNVLLESARDLFGNPPKRRTLCRECGVQAEPYMGGICWPCTHTPAKPKPCAAQTQGRVAS